MSAEQRARAALDHDWLLDTVPKYCTKSKEMLTVDNFLGEESTECNICMVTEHWEERDKIENAVNNCRKLLQLELKVQKMQDSIAQLEAAVKQIQHTFAAAAAIAPGDAKKA